MDNSHQQPAAHPVADSAADSSPSSRVERIIATGRLVIIPYCLLAFGIDPAAGGLLSRIGFAFMAGYFVYVIGVCGYVWLMRAPTQRCRVADQALDGTAGFVLMTLTDGTSSPFFSYLTFPVLFATFRWQWRGALGAGTPTAAAFVALGVLEIHWNALFETYTFITRTVYLGALTGLLSSIGAYEQRVRRAMVAVATWNPPAGIEAADIAKTVEMAGAVVGARRAVVAWAEGVKPGFQIAFWTGLGVISCAEGDCTADGLVAERLADIDFLSRDVATTAAPIMWTANGRLNRQHIAHAIPFALQHRFAMRSVISVRLHGELVRGRLFLLDMPNVTSDDLVMVRLLARQLQARLEHRVTARQLAATAAAEERIRLAQNVHDGVLQTLTGIRLQLEAARHLITARPEEAEGILLELEDVVLGEHQTLRRLVTRLQRAESGIAELDGEFADMVTALVVRIERQWNVRVKVLTPIVNEQFEAAASKAVIGEVYQILREALVNAARHARAQTLTFGIRVENGAVNMTVADDGEGFPFTGRHDLRKLIRHDMGPTVLRQRVAALDGELTIESSPRGSRLEISIPLSPPARLSARSSSTER
jgi:signal transduction histidine kinase